MSRISACFKSLQRQNKQALIPYITAGDPNPSITVGLMHKMVIAGADIIELGIPFSDPMADGPAIQLACERALKHDTSLTMVLDMVAEFRLRDNSTPVVLMGYFNTVESMGYKAFIDRAAIVGLDGILMVDLPPEECTDFTVQLRQVGLDIIFLLAPTTDPERMQQICSVGSGYLYYVSVKGVTGSMALDVAAVTKKLAQVRQYTNLPLAVGFGVRNTESVAKIAQIADGVVVGSVLVNLLDEYQTQPQQGCDRIATTLAQMRVAMDR